MRKETFIKQAASWFDKFNSNKVDAETAMLKLEALFGKFK